MPRTVFFPFFLLIFPFFISSQENIDENSLEIILSDVVRHLSDRNYTSALALFDRLPPENAESREIILMRASILNSAGRPAEAKQLANRVIAEDSNNTEALMILADAAKLQDQTRDRRVFLERIVAIDPAHARALNDLGNLALGNRNLFVAANYFDRALSAEPDNGESLVGRAVVARYNREPRKSEQLLNSAANLYPEWARPFQERARLYRGSGFYSDALEDLDEAKRLEPDNYWIILDRGLVLMDMSRKQDALEEFTRAIEIDPDVFLAYVYSAGIKDESGDYEGALKDYTVLGKLRPDYYFAFEGIGVIRMKNKQWTEARDAFLDAYRQAPKEYTYALLAAVNWMRAGRQTDPKQFLAQVLRTAPRDTHEYTLLRLFHDLRGETEAASKIESEQNVFTKARMLFYLASYYDITGSRTLANRYYLMVQELDAAASIEWKLNEWILMERGLGLRAVQ